ncbi:MAG: carboxy terminal-processing peptidase [Gammaproteobacteria bacterium]|nr:carboxy terminal-processing peptidase [Gammaproteobacteria bacterium]
MALASLTRTRIIIALTLLVSLLGGLAYTAPNVSPFTLVAEETYAPTTRQIARYLQAFHYQKLSIDDAMSSKLLDQYLKQLDPGRSYFLQADIAEFEKYRNTLDDDLKSGQLTSAFIMFNRLKERRTQQLNFFLESLPQRIQQFDYKKEEALELKREDAPWPANTADAYDLWRRQLKAEVLNLRLANNDWPKITTDLQKRYRNQLNRLNQIKNDDVFQSFIGVYTHLYDPHTDYMSPKDVANFEIHMSNKLEGIGAELQGEEDYTKIVRVIPGSPAEKTNQLNPADRVIGVGQNDKGEIIDVVGWRLDEVVELIRGKKGTTVRLQIQPANTVDTSKVRIVSIVRDEIRLEDQYAQKKIIEIKRGNKNYRIGVIELKTFYLDWNALRANDPNYASSLRDVSRILSELQDENVDGIVMDLRDNGGGSLPEVSAMMGLFIPSGPVVQIRYQNERVEAMGDDDKRVLYAGPLVVVVNRLSASASEILAGAIQDYRRGLVVGGQTFGKGTVQSLEDLAPGQIKLTQAKFYRISGDSTQSRGVVPDISFPDMMHNSEIGEAALPNALPWDQIKPANYQPISRLHTVVPALQKKHTQRVLNNPDFKFLNDRIVLLDEIQKTTQMSLSETTRRKEQQKLEQRQLDMENNRRIAKNLKPFKTFAEYETDQTENKKTDTRADDVSNSLITESAHIVVDMIQTPAPKKSKR